MLRVFLIVACLVSFCGTNKLLLCELYIYKGVVCLFPYMQAGLLLVVSSVLLQHIPSSTAAVKSSGLWQCVEPRGGSHWSPSLSLFTEYSANIPLPRTLLLSFITMTTYFSLRYTTTAASHINPPNFLWLCWSIAASVLKLDGKGQLKIDYSSDLCIHFRSKAETGKGRIKWNLKIFTIQFRKERERERSNGKL